MEKVNLTLHSGANDTVPNTRQYLDSCIGIKADFIEVDARSTVDGTVILHHNPDIQGLQISTSTYTTLQEADKNLTTLEEAMVFAKENNFKLNIDLKDISTAKPLATVLQKASFVQKCVISGCHKEDLLDIRAIEPEAKIIFNLEPEDFVSAKALAARIDMLKELEPIAANLNYRLLASDQIGNLLEFPIPLCVWTVDTEEGFTLCSHFALNSITTNHPALFFRHYGSIK
jgi:glycerophosphoryl diester phosphodiesterase